MTHKLARIEMERTNGDSRYAYYLRSKNQEFRLELGECFVGRNPACQIVLVDPRASRNHAVLRITERAVVLQDLDSANGVYLNEERIERPEKLRHGDRIVIGTQEFIFAVEDTSPDSASISVEEISGVVTPPDVPAMSSTVDGDPLDYLGRLADKMLALGRVEAAERVLGAHLREIEGLARSGAPVVATDLMLAAKYALRLAGAACAPEWANYTIRLYALARRPMPTPVSTELGALLRRIPHVDRQLMVRYQEFLAAHMHQMAPADRELCHQVLALPPPL
ncbi:MAG: FHA domain-containing protein [Myxococcales bacterium]|nr:FHA domain-containing protein [Myxococcales bacterium]